MGGENLIFDVGARDIEEALTIGKSQGVNLHSSLWHI